MPEGPKTQISIPLTEPKRQNQDDLHPASCSEKDKGIYKKLQEVKGRFEYPIRYKHKITQKNMRAKKYEQKETLQKTFRA